MQLKQRKANLIGKLFTFCQYYLKNISQIAPPPKNFWRAKNFFSPLISEILYPPLIQKFRKKHPPSARGGGDKAMLNVMLWGSIYI